MTMMLARIGMIAAFLSMGMSKSIQQMDEEAAVLMRDYAGELVKMPIPHPGRLEFNIEGSSILHPLQPFYSPVDQSDALFVTGPRRRSWRRSWRRLQDTCEVGDAFTLSSTIYSDAEGCYIASEDYSDFYGMVGTNRYLFTASFVSSSEVYWVSAALFASTDGSVYADVECYAEYVTGSHPTDADSWGCILGSLTIGVSGDSFNLTCGCEELNDTPGGFGCGSTDNFTITSGQLPTLDGCYLYTGNMNSTAFSRTGELIVGEVAVYTGYMNSEETDRRWFVGTYETNSTSEDLTATCISLGDPDEASPADTFWYCDFAGIGIYTQVNEDQFRVDCNCSGTWAPSPAPTTQVGLPIQSGSESTPPTPAPTKESFCSTTDSFSITSEQLQDLEGCYSDTGDVLSRSFAQAGELTVGEVAVYMEYVDSEDEDQRWFVGIFNPNTTSENLTAKCISSEDPNGTHPSDASWVCDFTGTGAYTATDEDTFRVDCDCNDTTTPTPIILTYFPTMPIDPAASNRGYERVPIMGLSLTLTCITSFILAAL